MAGKLKLALSLQGGMKLIDKLNKNAMSKDPLRLILNKAVLLLQRDTQIRTPVDTGRLRASWTRTVDSKPFPEFAQLGTNVIYAPFVEFGTANMEARHVAPGGQTRILGSGPLSKGVEAAQKGLNAILGEAKNIIEKRWGKK